MHTVLHIGAGQASELPQWLESGAQHIVLVEPHPELAEQLRQQTSSNPRVTVVEAAITCDPASNQLHEYNLPEASSLRQATGLKRLFPGLKAVNTHSVTTLTPGQLLEKYGPAQGEAATLVLQAPGEEQAIIQALAEEGELSRFSQLLLTTNPEPLYEGSEAGKTLLNTLQALGYNIQQENHQDPDWSTWQLARDPQQDKIAALEQSLEALEQQLAAMQKAHKAEAEKQQQQLQQHQEDHARQAEQLSALEQQLAQAQQQKAEAEQRAHNAEQGQKHTATELEEARKTIVGNTRALDEAIKASADSAQVLDEARQQLEAAQQAHKSEVEKQQQQYRAERAKQAEELAQARQTLKKEQDANKKIVDDLEEAKSITYKKEKLLKEALQQVEEKQLMLREIEKDLADNKKWLKDSKLQEQQQSGELSKLKSDNEKLQQSLRYEKESLTPVLKELASGNKKILERQVTNEKLEELDEAITVLSRNLSKHVDRKLINAAKQIETSMGLRDFLVTGQFPLNYHGWPISPDLALYLAEKVELEDYDLIIEFGSGTSTVLFAKVLMNKINKQRFSASEEVNRNGKSGTSVEACFGEAGLVDGYNLYRKIITFEHDSYYYDKTASMLHRDGLDKLVNLVYAPLVDCTYQGERYLYYDCDRALKEVADLYDGRELKVLVLVDGPPGATGPNARYPALPKLLSCLPKAQFQVVLDDYNRADEKNVAKMWLELIKKRTELYSETQMPFEKGAVCISINML